MAWPRRVARRRAARFGRIIFAPHGQVSPPLTMARRLAWWRLNFQGRASLGGDAPFALRCSCRIATADFCTGGQPLVDCVTAVTDMAADLLAGRSCALVVPDVDGAQWHIQLGG